MRDTILRLLKSEVFWSALATIGAAIGFLFTNLKGKPFWYRRMSKRLARERGFYARLAHPFPDRPSEESEEGLAARYFEAVEDGLAGVEVLTPAERRATRENLILLVGELQKTHETLVVTLQPFATTDAKAFIGDWNAVEARLATIYVASSVISSAHTSCTRIEQLVRQLTSGDNALKNERLYRLGYSVVTDDREVILPVMRSVLARCSTEVKIIGESLRAGDVDRAIRLKEKYWFDIQHTYDRINRALDRMREATRQISIPA